MTADTPYLAALGELQVDAAKLLYYSLPKDGWDVCVLDYREAGPVTEIVTTLSQGSGAEKKVTPPVALMDALEDLRKYMAEQGDGVWLSATLKLENGRYAFDFNYTDKPAWQVAPPDDAYIEDLRIYPRSDDQIPEWYPRTS